MVLNFNKMQGLIFYYIKNEFKEYVPISKETWQDLKSYEPSKFTKPYEEYVEIFREIHNKDQRATLQLKSKAVEYKDIDDLNLIKDRLRNEIEGFEGFVDEEKFKITQFI